MKYNILAHRFHIGKVEVMPLGEKRADMNVATLCQPSSPHRFESPFFKAVRFGPFNPPALPPARQSGTQCHVLGRIWVLSLSGKHHQQHVSATL